MFNFKSILQPKRNKSDLVHDNKKGTRIAAFVSIPKNASNSVLRTFELGKLRNEETTTSLVIFENHQRASVLRDKYDLDQLFVFCFVRNPYDRCVSWYEYHKDLEPYKSLSFSDWVRQGMPHHWKTQNQTNYEAEGITPLLQYNFVEDVKMDFVGRIEHFHEDLSRVAQELNQICEAKKIKYRFKTSNQKLNESKRENGFEDYYDQETKEIVYSLLKKDFDHWDYPQ